MVGWSMEFLFLKSRKATSQEGDEVNPKPYSLDASEKKVRSISWAWARQIRDASGRWLAVHATQPAWLPPLWRRTWVSYSLVVLVTIAISALLALLSVATSGTLQVGSPLLLEVVIVALSFGAGPSLLAALLATVLLDYLIFPPHFTWAHTDPAKAVTILVFGMVGCAISLLASRVERARAQAEARAADVRTSEQETVRRMDEFIAVAGHELRTPLTALLANLELAVRRLHTLETTLSASQDIDVKELERERAQVAGLLEKARRQARRQNRLISDLLDMSRARADKLQLDLEMHDLIMLVRDGVEEQRQLYPERKIDLRLDLLTNMTRVPVRVDADRIGQVLANYLSNALKYSPKEAPVVVLLTKEVDIGGQAWARVEVRDGGSGLSADEQVRVWERFYRAPDIRAQSGTGGGLGLGLYISREIVERNGGRVGVDSSPDEGATFWFVLPESGGQTE